MILEQFVGHHSEDARPVVVAEMNGVYQFQQLIQQIGSWHATASRNHKVKQKLIRR